MVAASTFNERAASPIRLVHGVVTTGDAGKFLRLEGPAVTLDLKEHDIDDLGRIVGILEHVVAGDRTRPGPTPRPAP